MAVKTDAKRGHIQGTCGRKTALTGENSMQEFSQVSTMIAANSQVSEAEMQYVNYR
ncbi:hypothetical protein [Kitasatospora sp. NPDC001225]